MATCGTCRREITWARLEDGVKIAIDNQTSIKGPERFTLDYDGESELPLAIPMRADREFSGHPAHRSVCGKPYRAT